MANDVPPEERLGSIEQADTDKSFAADNITDHQRKSILLREELQFFKAYVSENQNDNTLWITDFRKILERPPTATEQTDIDFGPVNSLWSYAKTCKGITAFRQNYEIFTRQEMRMRKGEGHVNNTARVDIICQNGAKWIKIYNMTAKKAFWAFANAGYGGAESDQSDSGAEDDDSDDPTGLIRIAKSLLSASQLAIHRSEHPAITIVLPRFRMKDLQETKIGDPKLILNVFSRLKSLGITIQTSEDIPTTQISRSLMYQMTHPDFSTFSSTINIDTTILLAIVSDISHGRVESQDWHHSMISLQIEKEHHLQLLPEHIWPACVGRELVCTREAVDIMQTIVDDIATDTERARAALLFEREGMVLTREERIARFQDLSQYEVPSAWALPIKVVDVDLKVLKSSIPKTGEPAAHVLSLHHGKPSIEHNPVNACVFLYGWSEGIVTITSNSSATKSVEEVVLANEDENGLKGPDIWCLPYPRSLVGKEKYKRVV